MGERATKGLELVRDTFEKVELIHKCLFTLRADKRAALIDDDDL